MLADKIMKNDEMTIAPGTTGHEATRHKRT